MTFPRGGDLEPSRELPHKEITDMDEVRPIDALDSSVLSKTFSNPITTIQRGFPQSPTTPKKRPFPQGSLFLWAVSRLLHQLLRPPARARILRQQSRGQSCRSSIQVFQIVQHDIGSRCIVKSCTREKTIAIAVQSRLPDLTNLRFHHSSGHR